MTDPSRLLSEIRALERSLHRPEVRHSRALLEALLGEGFVEFGASGTVYERDEIIDLMLVEEPDDDPDTLQSDDYALTIIAPDAVLLTYKTCRRQPDGSERAALRSSIWKKTGASWQMLFHQGTLTANIAATSPSP